MILIERLDFVGLCKEEFLILKVSSAIVSRSRYLDTLHFALPQAVVLANSDCQLENQTAIETLKETLLSSLHDVINCVRCDYTSTCLLYTYLLLTVYLYIHCIYIYCMYVYLLVCFCVHFLCVCVCVGVF